MPYRSKSQAKYIHAKHPEIAKIWDAEYGVPDNLPERVRKKRTSSRLTSRLTQNVKHIKRYHRKVMRRV